jgi:RNA polymerase sigma-54 factor
MALGPRLDLRQSQSLVMTPQLQQAIKLLALSNLELETFIGQALEANPLLEAGDVRADDAPLQPLEEFPAEPGADSVAEGDSALDIDLSAIDRDRDTGDSDWGGALSAGGSGEEGLSIDERGAAGGRSLADHLHTQIGAAAADAREALIAAALIDLIDDAGYVTASLSETADMLGVPLAEVERALALVQSLDPTGVGARTLAECIALQAKEADRYDPCMARLIDNLDLLARGEIARLRRMCDVDEDDFADMLAELRSYDPKPGLAFDSAGEAAIVPDILLSPAPKGDGWDIQLNEATLPRAVVNRAYYVELRGGCTDKQSRAWLSEQLAEANWLIKALDQRARTILKVAAEIVKQQDGFFRRGVSELRPLTLRTVADAIEMHESTVSRVTSNKYIACPRGTFELKYFFTSGVASADGEGASSEAVKAAIRELIDAEDPRKILSDDTLVTMLKDRGFDLARRTVAKYREAMGIGSSVQRRRAKKLAILRG